MATSANELRRQARHLENDLEIKLVSFSKLCANNAVSRTSIGNGSALSASFSDSLGQNLVAELQQLINKLSEINNKMADAATHVANSSSLIHSLHRHRDILQDYTQEFEKLSANFRAQHERDQLLSSAHRGSDSYKTSGVNRRADIYLKEHEHLRSSDRLLDDTISIAMHTRGNLSSQREIFKSIRTKVNTMGNRFPVINSLMQRIGIRKRRDALILGSVIGLCIIVLLLYALR
uniref:Golgi SNAP receptor complex member 1 isoform X2 n=1 Tax=Myxine glutinosa TaxID=7769 RepID=UPI00358FF3C1